MWGFNWPGASGQAPERQEGSPAGAALPAPKTPHCRRRTFPVTSDPPSKIPARLGGGPHTGVLLGCLPDPEGFCCYCGNKMPATEV